jgi:hypothetical protein
MAESSTIVAHARSCNVVVVVGGGGGGGDIASIVRINSARAAERDASSRNKLLNAIVRCAIRFYPRDKRVDFQRNARLSSPFPRGSLRAVSFAKLDFRSIKDRGQQKSRGRSPSRLFYQEQRGYSRRISIAPRNVKVATAARVIESRFVCEMRLLCETNDTQRC